MGFRRDFNFNCDIRSTTTLAKAYNCKINMDVVPPYIIDGHTFRCQEILGPDAATTSWLSPAVMVGIWLWQLRINVRFWQLPDADLQATFILQRDAIDVCRWRYIHSDRFDPIYRVTTFFGETLFIDFTTFDRGAIPYHSPIGPEGYPP